MKASSVPREHVRRRLRRIRLTVGGVARCEMRRIYGRHVDAHRIVNIREDAMRVGGSLDQAVDIPVETVPSAPDQAIGTAP